MLEALIAILIVALGVLGIVGLYARSVQNVDDSKFRGEAALLVDQLGRADVDIGSQACKPAGEIRQRRRPAPSTPNSRRWSPSGCPIRSHRWSR